MATDVGAGSSDTHFMRIKVPDMGRGALGKAKMSEQMNTTFVIQKKKPQDNSESEIEQKYRNFMQKNAEDFSCMSQKRYDNIFE